MKIGIYGLGRFGTFWARELAKHFDVVGFSKHLENKPDLKGLNIVSLEDLMKSEVVFLCNSISSMDEVVKEIADLSGDKTVIADTCSVKIYPLEIMKKYLADGKFVMTHPMFGPDSGANGVQGLPVVVDSLGNEELFDKFNKIFSKMKLKIIKMTCDEHDRQAAYSQGLTHFIGRVLGNINLEKIEIGTHGYNLLLEVIKNTCNDSLELFKDLQQYNPYTKIMRSDVYKSLDEIKCLLDGIC